MGMSKNENLMIGKKYTRKKKRYVKTEQKEDKRAKKDN